MHPSSVEKVFLGLAMREESIDTLATLALSIEIPHNDPNIHFQYSNVHHGLNTYRLGFHDISIPLKASGL